MIITIDGPAGSGKSSVAKSLSEKLGFYYLYTGLLYRAVAYILVHKNGKKIDELNNLTKEDLDFIPEISYEYKNRLPHIFFYGEDLTDYLNDSAWDQPASIVSAENYVRLALLDLQRNVAKKYDIIADGRDCGSVVFLNADYKFFLTASLDVRAQRIMGDEKRGGKIEDLQKVKVELEKRDKRDRERKIAPLIKPEGAIVIDNSNMSKEETLKVFLSFIKI